MPKSIEIEPLLQFVVWALIFIKNLIKEGASMKPCKDNRYATNKGGIIKAPKPVTDSPKSTVVKGSDLRNGK